MIIFIQARYNSKRLYGKVLKKIYDKTLLGWIIDRLNKSNLGIAIAVLTSDRNSDEPIARYCCENKIKFFRGDLNNVAWRFVEAARFFKQDEFVRISGDSPLFDPEILKKALSISNSSFYDVVSNVKKRTFPKGQSVEIIKLKSLERLLDNGLNEDEKEHVTKGFYSREGEYKIINFESNKPMYSDLQLSVDNLDDFKLVNKIISKAINKEKQLCLGWEDLSEMYFKLKTDSQ